MNTINWFEIPVIDFERAKAFYQAIFQVHLLEMEIGDVKLAMFPSEMGSGKVSGALCIGEGYTPSKAGTLIYFNGNPDLQNILDRVTAAGGTVTLQKTQVNPEIGYMAFFNDTEGNRLALHSDY